MIAFTEGKMIEMEFNKSSDIKIKKKYKIYVIVFLIMLIGCLTLLIAKATLISDDLSGVAKSSVAKWSIKVLDKYTKESAMQGVTFKINDTNNNVKEGSLAPGTTAIAKLLLDPTGSEVPIDYTISIDSNFKQIPGLVIKEVTKTIDGNIENILIDDSLYSDSLTLNQVKSNTVVLFEIVLEWANKEENNEQDTLVGQTVKTITIPITITAQQHID